MYLLSCPVPDGVYSIGITVIGAGGDGADGDVRYGSEDTHFYGGGGGGSAAIAHCTLKTEPGVELDLLVGDSVDADGQAHATQVIRRLWNGEVWNVANAEGGKSGGGYFANEPGPGGPVGSSSVTYKEGSCWHSHFNSAQAGNPGSRGEFYDRLTGGSFGHDQDPNTVTGGTGGMVPEPVPPECVNPDTGTVSGTGGNGGSEAIYEDLSQPGTDGEPGCLQLDFGE
ncbi:hypothetical protein [Streptomyces sp. YIM 121038]|uniref:hypothetical protein n=1 Tax=Streptomyces sp. YIM 121038 TaxID=2136401 RepID=UPI0011100DEC|nr:hypothetical protein [Streptomyces sp. YIM 121038]